MYCSLTLAIYNNWLHQGPVHILRQALVIIPDQKFPQFSDTQVITTSTFLLYVLIKSHLIVAQQVGGMHCGVSADHQQLL